MALDFPTPTTVGQVFTQGSLTYIWDGTKWVGQSPAAVAAGVQDKIEEGNTLAEVVDTGSDGHFKVTTEGTERLRIDSSGNVGIGTSSIDGTLHLDAGTNTDIIIEKDNAGYGSLRFHNDGSQVSFIQLDASEDMTYYGGAGVNQIFYSGGYRTIDLQGGNVGIGTTSPTSKFDVHTTNTSGINFTSVGNTPRLDFFSNNIETAGRIQVNEASGGGVMSFATKTTGGTSTERMRIDSSGRVGIGVSSLNSSSRLTLLESTGNSQTLEIKGANTGGVGSQPGIKFTASTGDNIGGIFGDTNSDAVVLQSGGTERMRIDSSGRLLLGTTTEGISDGDNLTIADSGNCGITVRSGSSNGGAIYFSNATSGSGEYAGFVEYLHNVNALRFATSGSEHMRIDSSGRIGIGTTSPSAQIEIEGNVSSTTQFSGFQGLRVQNANGAAFGVTADINFVAGTASGNRGAAIGVEYMSGSKNDLYFATSGGSVTSTDTLTERMRIDSSGQLALGRTSQINVAGNSSTSVFEQLSNNNYPLALHSAQANNRGLAIFYANTGAGNSGDPYIICQNNTSTKFVVNSNGNATFAGAVSKGSGSFKISHPLPAKSETHHLVHSFIEGPQADLIYRGYVDLVDGQATVNIDTAGRMSEGTFEVLCTNVSCFTSNESDWTAVKGSVTGNVLTITAQDATATSKVSWMVVGERKDQHMIDTEWTDDAGRVITEPEKVVEAVEETEE